MPDADRIQVSVTPRHLVAGRREQLEIRLTNTGAACTKVVCELAFPREIRLVSGSKRIEVEDLSGGKYHLHAVTVEPTRSGEFRLTSPNFSYRDESYYRVRRDGDWEALLSVAPSPLRPRPNIERDGAASPVAGHAARPVATADIAGDARPPRGSRVRTVLFLASSPTNLERIRPDLELKKIKFELRLDQNRDDFLLEAETAAQLEDVNRALGRYRPSILHFSGHGDEEGRLYVEDERGRSKPTNVDGLASLFGRYKATIRCVVVNACYSERLAEAVSRHVGYAVGMSSQVGDRAAVLFSVGFYQAIFGGEDITDAFESGCVLLHSDEATAGEHLKPVLYRSGRRISRPGEQR